ncbi:serine arginine repetitive matrix 1-like isoform X3 [Brachionus plicatilis]|uniref:Serine arginine repetitive matrix 1-like isoform X3 n=1 Tax=Brachionus plicatilis TaxID=10195 RepID=A0A3M7QPQ8_BRAPC|nr:serine arginine repetitive matrix 1-like isoform X3 [Brachionus plicatilis]
MNLFEDELAIGHDFAISGRKIELSLPRLDATSKYRLQVSKQSRLINHFNFENNTQMFPNGDNLANGLPEIAVKDLKKSPRVALKPDTFKLPLYNGHSHARDQELPESINKHKRLEPITKYADYYKSDENIRSKLLKFKNMEKKLSQYQNLNSLSNQELNSFDSNIDQDSSEVHFHSSSSRNFKMARSSLKKPEISRAILKCKTPIYYSPEENIRNIKTPVHISSGRWSPIKIRSNKNLKLHERFKIRPEYKSIFNNLDEDKDGHLNFDSVKSQYCKNMDHAQVSFFYQIYDYLSEATYFGLQEFSTFYQLVEGFVQLDYKNTGFYWDIFISSDFEDYRKDIKDYINLIDQIDFESDVNIEDVMRTKIKSLDTLTFNSQQSKMKMEANKINQILNQKIKGSRNDKDLETKLVNFILYIPVFIYLESFFKNKQIFQRKNNSILNSKESTNFHNFNKRSN